MDGDGAGGYSVGTLDKPTTRLSQYARGKTGSMNPFTPGGEVKLIAVLSLPQPRFDCLALRVFAKIGAIEVLEFVGHSGGWWSVLSSDETERYAAVVDFGRLSFAF